VSPLSVSDGSDRQGGHEGFRFDPQAVVDPLGRASRPIAADDVGRARRGRPRATIGACDHADDVTHRDLLGATARDVVRVHTTCDALPLMIEETPDKCSKTISPRCSTVGDDATLLICPPRQSEHRLRARTRRHANRNLSAIVRIPKERDRLFLDDLTSRRLDRENIRCLVEGVE
jgi:hypothetical protein